MATLTKATANGEPCASCEARAFSICGVLREQDLARLASAATFLEAAPGEPLVRRGQAAQHVFNISAGAARVFKTLPDGRRQIVGFLFRGDFLGWEAEEAYAYEAEALTVVRACRFARPDFRDMLDEFPAMERRLLCMASDEMREAHEHMLVLGRKSAAERLATFLLRLARRSSNLGGAENVADMPMNRADIADYLGLTSETVSRQMTQMKASGLVSFEGARRARILRPQQLETLAEGR